MLGNTECDDQRGIRNAMIKTSEGISALIYSLVFVSLSATEVHSRAANAGLSIKEVDSVASLEVEFG